MLILANSYASIAPVTPLAKFFFLVLIILFEAIYLKDCWKDEKILKIIFHVSIANIFSALVGFLIGVASFFVDILLQSMVGILFFTIEFLVGKINNFIVPYLLLITICVIIFPWSVWFLCYRVSCFFEFRYLSRYIKSAQCDKKSVINANKWTYGFLGLVLLYATIMQIFMQFGAYSPRQQPPDLQPSSSTCASVDSRRGWQSFDFPRNVTRITSISGGWSVDTRSYSPVGATGHSGRDAEALTPFNQYKFDQRFPFGAVLMGSGQGVLWIQSPVSLNSQFSAVNMRINDADNALGDNGGSIQVCFGD